MVKKILLVFVIGVPVLFLLIALLMSSSCEKSYSEKVFSSDRMYAVQIIETSCGGLLGDLTSDVIISKVKKNVWDYLNFVGNHNTVFILGGSKSSIKTTWLKNRSLKITYSYCRGVYGRDTNWKDITIIYDKQCSDPQPLPNNLKNMPKVEDYINK